MASKRGIRRRMCNGKKQYRTQQDAINTLHAEIAYHRIDKSMNVYHCRFCGQWHIGGVPLGVLHVIRERQARAA